MRAMSATYGPCPRCGEQTMYDNREPTLCPQCQQQDMSRVREWQRVEIERQSQPPMNRKARRAAKSKQKKGGR